LVASVERAYAFCLNKKFESKEFDAESLKEVRSKTSEIWTRIKEQERKLDDLPESIQKRYKEAIDYAKEHKIDISDLIK